MSNFPVHRKVRFYENQNIEPYENRIHRQFDTSKNRIRRQFDSPKKQIDLKFESDLPNILIRWNRLVENIPKKLVSGFSKVSQINSRDCSQQVRCLGRHRGGLFSFAISSGVFWSNKSVNS